MSVTDRRQTADQLRRSISSLQWKMEQLGDQLEALEEELVEREHECPNCGEHSPRKGKPCSRACRYQLEWADELKRRDS